MYIGNFNYDKTEEDLISLMATARMFNLDDAADIVSKVMFSLTDMENVIYFYYSFGSYGYPELEEELFRWILLNFSYWNEMQHEAFCLKVLNRMEATLLEKLITHEDFIVKNEVTLYGVLRKWLVDKMKLRDDYDYFKIWGQPEPFLETEVGAEFERIFSMLNLHHLLMEKNSLEHLKKDRIYPLSYLQRAGAENYMKMVQLASTTYIPNTMINNNESFRLSIMHPHGAHSFTGALVNYFGIHLKFGWNGNMLTVQRNRRDKEMLFHHGPITIRFRISFYTPETFRTDKAFQVSGMLEHEIRENELVNLMEWKCDDVSNVMSRVNPIRSTPAASPFNFAFYLRHDSLAQAAAAAVTVNTLKFPKVIGIEMIFVQQESDVQVIDDDEEM